MCMNVIIRAGGASLLVPNSVAAPLCRGRVRMTVQLLVSKLTQIARMLTLPARTLRFSLDC